VKPASGVSEASGGDTDDSSICDSSICDSSIDDGGSGLPITVACCNGVGKYFKLNRLPMGWVRSPGALKAVVLKLVAILNRDPLFKSKWRIVTFVDDISIVHLGFLCNNRR
jgi:hypothetical protein